MHIDVLVEEPSAEAALSQIIPKIIGSRISFRIITFQGKHDLMKKLPQRLFAIKKIFGSECRVLVLVDRDQQNCIELKKQLDKIANQSKLITKSNALPVHGFQVVNRIAIEELEAWFFGDPDAITQAYPKVSQKIYKGAAYRNPDAVRGGTWEALERVLQAAGYYPSGLLKIKAAQDISEYMDPIQNRSKSFQVFRDGLLSLIQ